MKVTVEFRPRRQSGRDIELPLGSTVGALLAAVGQSPDSTVVVRGKTPIPEGELLVEGETLMMLSSFSGG